MLCCIPTAAVILVVPFVPPNENAAVAPVTSDAVMFLPLILISSAVKVANCYSSRGYLIVAAVEELPIPKLSTVVFFNSISRVSVASIPI